MKVLPGTRERIKKIFSGEAEARAKRLVMFLNDISVYTPPRNIHTAIAAIRHFGKLPFKERPLESFRPPEVESFESFMGRYRTL